MKHLLKPAVLAFLWPNDSRSESNPNLYAWGNNTSGQLGLGSEISKAFPSVVEDLKREHVSKVFSSGQCNSSVAINPTGEVFTWGNGLDNILGHNTGEANVITPTKINLENSFTKVAVGGGHMIGLTKDGKLISWGLDDCGQCGHEIVKHVVDPRAFRPQLLRGKSPGPVKGELDGVKIVDVACGKYFSVALSEEGYVYTWGAGREYALGHGNRDSYKTPKRVGGLEGVKITQIACGRNFVIARDSEGAVYSWGSNEYGQLGLGLVEKFKAQPQKLRLLKDVVDISSGDFHVLAVTSQGEVFSWGSGGDGQLGHGNNSSQATPTVINNLPKVAHVACGGGHSGFITQDFRLLMCGRGIDGQLGRQGKIESIASNRNIPLQVEQFSRSRVLQVAAGMHHSLALVIDN